jgi:hypothetical protein
VHQAHYRATDHMALGSSGREACVAMVQTTDLSKRDHLPSGGRVDGARIRTVLSQGQMRSGSVVVVPVRREDSTQMVRVEDDQMIQTLPPN